MHVSNMNLKLNGCPLGKRIGDVMLKCTSINCHGGSGEINLNDSIRCDYKIALTGELSDRVFLISLPTNALFI